MKKTFLLLALFVIVNCGKSISQTVADSAITSRNELYYQYLDIRNNTDKFREDDYIRLTTTLEKIVLCDNRLLDTLATRNKMRAEYRKTLDGRDEDIARLNREHKKLRLFLFISIAGGAIAIILLIIFLVLYFGKSRQQPKKGKSNLKLDEMEKVIAALREEIAQATEAVNEKQGLAEKTLKDKDLLETKLRERELTLTSLRNEIVKKQLDSDNQVKLLNTRIANGENEMVSLRKKMSEQEALINSTSGKQSGRVEELEKRENELTLELNKMKADLAVNESALNERNQKITDLENETQLLQSMIREMERHPAAPQADATHDEEYFKKLGNLDLQVIKLEKLDGLRQRGLITDEEFSGLKKKLLGDF